MKNFINSQKRIVDEIIISDSNYKQACLSFVEKTLKYITNDNSDSMVLINNYIDDEILLNNLHQIRKRANDIKHEYDEIDFSENLALKSLEVLDEYLSYINKKYPDVIEVVNFKQLYIERKNNWLKEHSIEIEKIVTVEKEIPILKKEIITIEKPIIKEIVKDTNESSYNKDYMEIQLLNEENKKGLFINSLNIKSYKLALEILLKKFERNIRLSKDEEKVLLENLDEFYVHIIDFLPKYQLSNIFSTTTIIEFLNLEIKLNKKSLLLKYIKDEKYIDLEQSKMEIIIKQYIINNKKEALSIIIKYKNKFTPTNKMRKILSSTLELFELINIISDFENQSYLNTALFNKLNENYNIQTNKKLIDLLKLYPWGQKIICLEYILNEPKLITYDIFKECYRKINKSEINILILTNSKQRSLNIIKKLEKENIYLIDDLYKICSNKSCWSIEELIPSIASIIEFDNKYLSYKLVSPLIINYYIKNNQIQEQSLLKEILIDSLYNVNLERTNILLDKTEIDLTEDEMIDKIKEEISSNKQINVVYNALKKYGNVPISLLKSCFEYNFNLSCELFGDYLSKNLHIFDKYYTFSNNKKDYIFNYELVIKILTYLANVISEPYKLKKILYYGIKYYNSRWGKTNILISLIKIINEKGIYIYNIIPTFNDFFSNPNKYDRLSDLFENNTELINNLDLKHPIKLFSTNFILENIDSPNINIYLKHKSCSNSELVIEILRENDLKLIKKAFNIGIDFNVKCKQYWDRKSMSPLEYYKEHIYEQKIALNNF